MALPRIRPPRDEPKPLQNLDVPVRLLELEHPFAGAIAEEVKRQLKGREIGPEVFVQMHPKVHHYADLTPKMRRAVDAIIAAEPNRAYVRSDRAWEDKDQHMRTNTFRDFVWREDGIFHTVRLTAPETDSNWRKIDNHTVVDLRNGDILSGQSATENLFEATKSGIGMGIGLARILVSPLTVFFGANPFVEFARGVGGTVANGTMAGVQLLHSAGHGANGLINTCTRGLANLGSAKGNDS